MRRFVDAPLPPPRPQDLNPPVKNADKDSETTRARGRDEVSDGKGDRSAHETTAVKNDATAQSDSAAKSDATAKNDTNAKNDTKSNPPQPPPESANDNEAKRTALLTGGTMIADALPPIGNALPAADGAGACGIAAPVLLKAVVLSGGKKVDIVPPATLRASLAAAVADWVREDLEPALVADGDRLTSIEGTGGYECRDRNRLVGGKISEHAIGNALDMRTLVTAKGLHISVIPDTSDEPKIRAFRDVMKMSACSRFMTVLGPGADIFHAAHLHVDLEARHSGAHLCQWDLQFAAKAAVPTR